MILHIWLRQCTTNWKVTGLIPDGVTGIFHWHNPSSRTMVLRFTQPLTETSTQEYFLGDKCEQCVGLTTLPPSCADCLEIWEPQPPGILWACPGLQWKCFTFTFIYLLVLWLFFHFISLKTLFPTVSHCWLTRIFHTQCRMQDVRLPQHSEWKFK
jgi:hypothetical protein